MVLSNCEGEGLITILGFGRRCHPSDFANVTIGYLEADTLIPENLKTFSKCLTKKSIYFIDARFLDILPVLRKELLKFFQLDEIKLSLAIIVHFEL